MSAHVFRKSWRWDEVLFHVLVVKENPQGPQVRWRVGRGGPIYRCVMPVAVALLRAIRTSLPKAIVASRFHDVVEAYWQSPNHGQLDVVGPS